MTFLFSPAAVGEPDNGMAKVAQWQQSLYAVDSGINSGATTVRDDTGEYTTREYNYTVTNVSREESGKKTSNVHLL